MEFKKKLLIVAAIFFTAVGGLVFLAINPLVANINNYGALMEEQRAKIALAEGRMEAIKQFRTFIKEEGEDFKKIDNLFVDGNMPLDFINYLEETAAAIKVKMKVSPAISQNLPNGEWPYLNFKLELSGKTEDILNFIDKIESGRYLVELSSVLIDAGRGKNEISSEKKVLPPAVAEAQIIFKAYAK